MVVGIIIIIIIGGYLYLSSVDFVGFTFVVVQEIIRLLEDSEYVYDVFLFYGQPQFLKFHS